MIRTDNSKVIELLQSQLEERDKEISDLKREVREFAEWASGNGWYFNAEINVWIYINYTALGISS
jgi:hypothetical protein